MFDYMINDEDDIVTLGTSDGERTDFIELATITYKGGRYSVLEPVIVPKTMKENEVVIFSVIKNADGEVNYIVEKNPEIVEGVFQEFLRRLDCCEDGDGDGEEE